MGIWLCLLRWTWLAIQINTRPKKKFQLKTLTVWIVVGIKYVYTIGKVLIFCNIAGTYDQTVTYPLCALCASIRVGIHWSWIYSIIHQSQRKHPSARFYSTPRRKIQIGHHTQNGSLAPGLFRASRSRKVFEKADVVGPLAAITRSIIAEDPTDFWEDLGRMG